MAKNTYESEITLDGHLSVSDYQDIQEKTLSPVTPSTFFQFYLSLPEEILKKVKKLGIEPNNIEGSRLRFSLEENRWELVVKEQEETSMKALRTSAKDALPAIIRKEHTVPLTDDEDSLLLKKNVITGLVIKQRYDLMKVFPRLFESWKLQPSEVTYDVVLSPTIHTELSEEARLPFRLEAEFANPEELAAFQSRYRQQFIEALNRAFEPYKPFKPQKLLGQKLMAKANVRQLLTERINPAQILKNLFDLSKKKRKRTWKDMASSLPDEAFLKPIEMEEMVRKSKKKQVSKGAARIHN